ncbi:dicarboxylate/amino acid:cation symporter [Corynebacterium liangguodongii]|uniref:Sodium:proton antiporter n=1 Tax=Corynebacterium liangguodongii TaxID=2079535 RepID=A0A2S0WGZ2_9CORY|nr:dicarboxylate/amino acid:cation symporter [Corynebacterium liangguodongii]AWB85058.1 sodium:proton antiporter [Corynebacterium liangguodongii]PWB99106.1 dicarboxylate/amino acid:cation symporter [Corynebacterium liangguodongii]
MKKFGFGAQVFTGLVVGLILGFVARAGGFEWLANFLTWVGSTYVQLLKLLIPPLVFTAVVTSVANLRKVTNAARLAGQTLIWFAITAFVSVLIGIAVALSLRPGETSTVDPAAAGDPSTTGSWLGFIESVVPANFLGLTAKASEDGAISIGFNVLQILVISLVVGVAAVKAGRKAQPFIEFSASLLEIIQVALWWVIRLAPIGSAALIGKAIATYGWEALGSLGMFVLAIYIGLALVIFALYPAVLALNRIPVREFYRHVWPVTTLGFVTRSSLGVLPVTQRTVEKSMGVPTEYASFAMPLAATTKMDGCASIYPAVAAIFVAQFYGIPLGVADYFLIIVVSVLGSAATAGTTGATVMLTLTLSALGLPLSGVGLLLAVEPIVDMGRTAVNVTGQAVVAAVVSKREGIIDEQAWEREPETVRA